MVEDREASVTMYFLRTGLKHRIIMSDAGRMYRSNSRNRGRGVEDKARKISPTMKISRTRDLYVVFHGGIAGLSSLESAVWIAMSVKALAWKDIAIDASIRNIPEKNASPDTKCMMNPFTITCPWQEKEYLPVILSYYNQQTRHLK